MWSSLDEAFGDTNNEMSKNNVPDEKVSSEITGMPKKDPMCHLYKKRKNHVEKPYSETRKFSAYPPKKTKKSKCVTKNKQGYCNINRNEEKQDIRSASPETEIDSGDESDSSLESDYRAHGRYIPNTSHKRIGKKKRNPQLYKSVSKKPSRNFESESDSENESDSDSDSDTESEPVNETPKQENTLESVQQSEDTFQMKDFIAFVVVGVLLIFVMEQFIRIGFYLKQ